MLVSPHLGLDLNILCKISNIGDTELEQWLQSYVPTWLNDVELWIIIFTREFPGVQLPPIPEMNIGK